MTADDSTRLYSTAFWLPRLAPLCAAQRIPLAFMGASIEEESGGNPVAVGKPDAKGPDGNPREMGILQFYNPDDLKLLGATGAELRAYAVPGMFPQIYKGKQIVGFSQRCSRPLTELELAKQANMAVAKIASMRTEAGHYAQAARVSWPSSGVEFWRLVKLVHGLPGLVHGLPAVAAHLGRPPGSWSEFRQVAESGSVRFDTKTESYRPFGWIFDNAEKATASMTGEAVS